MFYGHKTSLRHLSELSLSSLCCLGRFWLPDYVIYKLYQDPITSAYTNQITDWTEADHDHGINFSQSGGHQTFNLEETVYSVIPSTKRVRASTPMCIDALSNYLILSSIPQQIGTNHRVTYSRIDRTIAILENYAGGEWLVISQDYTDISIEEQRERRLAGGARGLVRDSILTSPWFAWSVISLTLICKCYATRVRKHLSISRSARNANVAADYGAL